MTKVAGQSIRKIKRHEVPVRESRPDRPSSRKLNVALHQALKAPSGRARWVPLGIGSAGTGWERSIEPKPDREPKDSMNTREAIPFPNFGAAPKKAQLKWRAGRCAEGAGIPLCARKKRGAENWGSPKSAR